MLLCSQCRRTSVGRRCSLLLYFGLDHAEPSASSGAAPCRHAASVLWATVHRGPATSALLWLLGPVERELFASGGRLAIGIDGPGMGPDYGAL